MCVVGVGDATTVNSSPIRVLTGSRGPSGHGQVIISVCPSPLLPSLRLSAGGLPPNT